MNGTALSRWLIFLEFSSSFSQEWTFSLSRRAISLCARWVCHFCWSEKEV